jgi:hypothetical protein
MPRLIRSAALNNYVELARSLGLDPYRMIAAYDLPAACLDDPEIKVPVTSVIKLLEESALRSGKIDFGLRLSENRTLANLGALALLVREQPTIRKALDALAGYMFLHSEALRQNRGTGRPSTCRFHHRHRASCTNAPSRRTRPRFPAPQFSTALSRAMEA